MPEVTVSSALPVTPAKAVGAESDATREGVNAPEGAQSFSSVLREKQAANTQEAAPASAKPAPESGPETRAKAAPGKDAEAAASAGGSASPMAAPAPDLAQLLAAAGMQARLAEAAPASDKAPINPDAPPAEAAMLALTSAPLTLNTPTDKTGGKPAALPANLAADPAMREGQREAAPSLLESALRGPAQQDKAALQDEPGTGTSLAALAQESAKPREGATPANSFASVLEQTGLSGTQQADMLRQSNAANSPQPGASASAESRVEVRTPVGQTGWAEEVGNKLVWTAQQDNGKAELVLTPAHLGRVEVSINLNGDQASANFIAASPAAREALQEAMPKLREMLAQSGINLGQADVSAGQSGQGSDAAGRQRGGTGSGRGDDGGTLDPNTASPGRPRSTGNGLVDTFA